MLITQTTTQPQIMVTPIFRSCRSQRAVTGHFMIGVIQHAPRQPGASPETIGTAQRLQEWQRGSQDPHQFAPRHSATTIGE